MSEVASRWALFASLALHAGVIALGLMTPRLRASPFLTDFWGGKTFEVPESPSDTGEGDAPSSEDESANEINVEGVDNSPDTRASIPSPPATEEATKPPPPARARAQARGSQGSAAPAASHGSGPGGTFGAENATAGTRDLITLFMRAAPMIASSDPVWSTLPLGPAGSTDVTLVLDDEGKPHVAGGIPGPAHLRRLIIKTVSIMSVGRFGIGSADGIVSQQKFHIALTLSQPASASQEQATAGGFFGLGLEPPDHNNVRHAFHDLGSGRRIEIAVREHRR